MEEILKRVKLLRAQGFNNNDIINSLQQQGISPREINDAISQSNIKQAVSEEQQTYPPQQQNQMQPLNQGQNQMPSQFQQNPRLHYQEKEVGNEEMQPSITNQQMPQQYNVPSPGAYPSYEQQMPEQSQYAQEYPATAEEYSYPESYGEEPQGYGENNYYGANPDTITEIAEQIISDKISKTNQNIKTLIEFKSLLTAKVERIDERLKKIEAIIDHLQISLIRKATEQEQNIGDIKTEMQGMQEGFSKILNPLTESIRESGYHRKIKRKSPATHKKTSKASSKKGKTASKKSTEKELKKLLKF